MRHDPREVHELQFPPEGDHLDQIEAALILLASTFLPGVVVVALLVAIAGVWP